MFDVNGYLGSADAVFGDVDLHHTSLCIEGFGGVEDKVADAVVDVVTTVALNGLQRVGVMAYQHVCTSLYQLMGLQSLTGHGL